LPLPVRNIALAFVLMLPASIILSAFISWLFSNWF
jgi:hypothetical protein